MLCKRKSSLRKFSFRKAAAKKLGFFVTEKVYRERVRLAPSGPARLLETRAAGTIERLKTEERGREMKSQGGGSKKASRATYRAPFVRS